MKCPVDHARAKRETGEWLKLAYVDRMSVPAGEGPDEPAYTLELRNCACGSTISRRVTP